MSTQPSYIHVANYSILAELQKRDEDLLAELHHLEWSQSDERQPNRQFPPSLLPVLKAQTAAWVTGTQTPENRVKLGRMMVLGEMPHYHQ